MPKLHHYLLRSTGNQHKNFKYCYTEHLNTYCNNEYSSVKIILFGLHNVD